MEIETIKDNSNLTIELEGRLDTNTAPNLEKKLGDLNGIDNLVFDFKKLEYISSAGLRVLLACQKEINSKSGSMIIKNVKEEILEVFDMTGFSDILTIEK